MTDDIALQTSKIKAWVDTGKKTGWLVFNQPEKRNALSLEMWQGMGDALEAMIADDRVRVIVLRGAGGKAFVSGADISEFDRVRANAEQKASYGKIAGRATKALQTCPKPVIAMIEGFCIGGGLATALSTDVRIATDDSTFGIPAGRLGLGYEYASVAKLAHAVGPARARDILLSARLFGADEAAQMGLVQTLASRSEIDAMVADYCARIASNAPLTLVAAKAALSAFERGGKPEEVAEAERLVSACFDSDDYKEGRRAFADKRTPDFSGR